MAEANGYFEEYGINPTLTIIEDESQYSSAMFSNGIQGLGNTLDREVIHYVKGTPEKIPAMWMQLLLGNHGSPGHLKEKAGM